MDIYNSLTAELYFWGHFDVLQDAAEQYAQKGNVNYQTILNEKVEHHLRTALRQLPLHQSLKDAVYQWFYTVEPFSEKIPSPEKEPSSKKCPDWDSWNFPNEKERKTQEYLLPVLHLCKLAVDAFEVASDGRLCRPDEEDIVHFTRFGCVPPSLLGATRYAMKKNLQWDGRNFAVSSYAATQEFQVLIQRGLADAHVHLSGAACFTDLLYAAIRGIAPPRSSHRGDYLENGVTHEPHDFPFHHLALRPLLLACKTMLAALLYHAGNPHEYFKNFLGDDVLSRRFWKFMYLAAKEPGSSFAMRFDMAVDNILKKVGNHTRFFNKNIPLEKNWFTIVRHVLESQDDKELCYHFIQLTRCICCLYRPMFHREGFYEFDLLFRYIDLFEDAAGHPDGRPPRRYTKDVPWYRIGYDSMQNHCENLQRLQLRTTVRVTKKRSPRRRPKPNAKKILIREGKLEVELQNHLATYDKYIEEQIKLKCCFCEKKININERQQIKCPHCGKTLPKNKPMMITFPIHFVRKEQGHKSIQRKDFDFKLPWYRIELLAAILLKKPALRFFFGRIDVANNEDLKPNWIFALMFQELEDRLRKITRLNSEMTIPRMRYNCHAGEHFTSSIQGLRRIWEAVHFFPHLDGIGHAFALGIPGRFPAEMPADELLDDLVWLQIHREHVRNIPLERLERIGERIAEDIYGTPFAKNDAIPEILFRDMKDAYLWRFDREKIAKYIGVLTHDKTTGEYHYNQYFKLPKDENDKPLPKASEMMQKHFMQKKVGQSCKLSKELREILEQCYPFLRDFVKQEIINKNIVVEVCPASNFRIGNLTKIEDHPLFAMCSPDTGGVSTVFGTDNPAMFQTSIDEEYLFIKEAMDKKYPDLPLEKRLEYLETIRRRSMDLCCDDLPDNWLEILNLIEKAGVK